MAGEQVTDIEPQLSFVVSVNRRFGGGGGVRDEGLLRAALGRPFTTVAGEDAFPSPFQKAAAGMEALCRLHPFVDGNKRTALVWTIWFLRQNGIVVVPDRQVDVGRFVVEVARGNKDVESIARFLELHSAA